jgi:hypothetical protein
MKISTHAVVVVASSVCAVSVGWAQAPADVLSHRRPSRRLRPRNRETQDERRAASPPVRPQALFAWPVP